MGNAKPKTMYVLTQEHILKHYDLKCNCITNRTEYANKGSKVFEKISDRTVSSMVMQCNQNRIATNQTIVRTVLNNELVVPKYNPFTEYLESLPEWDKTTDYIKEISDLIVTDCHHWEEWFKKYFVTMIASWCRKKAFNEVMLVLFGGQGIGKSTFIRNLLPDELQEYFYSGLIDPANKDHLSLATAKGLINIDELIGLNRKRYAELKELLTKQIITVRLPYAAYSTDAKRIATFAGTTNVEGFLYDLSGSRRFLCIDAKQINYAKTLQLKEAYSQAYCLINEGNFQYYFNSQDQKNIESHNKQFEVISPVEEAINAHFKKCNKGEESIILTATEVAHVIYNGKASMNESLIRSIGSFLTAKEFVKGKTKNGNNGYYLQYADEIDQFELFNLIEEATNQPIINQNKLKNN
jgi:predicted P-loop ATPase